MITGEDLSYSKIHFNELNDLNVPYPYLNIFDQSFILDLVILTNYHHIIINADFIHPSFKHYTY
jgi:hypothetical protein